MIDAAAGTPFPALRSTPPRPTAPRWTPLACTRVSCNITGGNYTAIYQTAVLDGTPVFFPVDGDNVHARGRTGQRGPGAALRRELGGRGGDAEAQLQLHERGPLLVPVQLGHDLHARLHRRRRRLGVHQPQARGRSRRHPHAGPGVGELRHGPGGGQHEVRPDRTVRSTRSPFSRPSARPSDRPTG